MQTLPISYAVALYDSAHEEDPLEASVPVKVYAVPDKETADYIAFEVGAWINALHEINPRYFIKVFQLNSAPLALGSEDEERFANKVDIRVIAQELLGTATPVGPDYQERSLY